MSKKIFYSSLLSIPGVEHGFLSRHFGKNQAEGVSAVHIAQVKQVHGKHVYSIQKEKDINVSKDIEADAMVTSLKNIALVIRTADCVPLLLYDPIQKVIAATHAGWRGTSKNIAKETIRVMTDLYSCKIENIIVSMGPCIQACCYEVDAPVYEALQCRAVIATPFLEKIKDKKDKWRLDLALVNKYQLVQTGVKEKKIWLSPNCTACQLEDFYSYRKEGASAGRQWSYILLA